MSGAFLWAELDSNQRRREPADLQSAPFGRFGICPSCLGRKGAVRIPLAPAMEG